MPLSDKEREQLEALQRKAEQPDEPDFEVEWWEETPDGNRRGGRLPWSKGKAIYGRYAPDLFGDKPEPSEAGQDDGGQDGGDSGVRRFGRRVS